MVVLITGDDCSNFGLYFNCLFQHGHSALMLASKSGHAALVELLLHYDSPVDQQSEVDPGRLYI